MSMSDFLAQPARKQASALRTCPGDGKCVCRSSGGLSVIVKQDTICSVHRSTIAMKMAKRKPRHVKAHLQRCFYNCGKSDREVQKKYHKSFSQRCSIMENTDNKLRQTVLRILNIFTLLRQINVGVKCDNATLQRRCQDSGNISLNIRKTIINTLASLLSD